MFRHQVEAGVLLENRCRCLNQQSALPEGCRKLNVSEAAKRRKNTAHARKPWVKKRNDATLKGRKKAWRSQEALVPDRLAAYGKL
jgi:hypothetical protein